MFEKIVTQIIQLIIAAAVGGVITYMASVRKVIPRVKSLEDWRSQIQRDTNDSAEERRLLLSGVLACLKGLQEQGCNGPVTRGIEALEEYMLDKTHDIRSGCDSKKSA